ncbi:cold-regulated 413 inner membrane protein 1, chloroplastic [Cinnamomum micranthum f. kanehirae]|uniref:Cold-regulated 413 inner membrane protein 1, chloroplastic n=1 Tax=Cinnamomum micranthum f. kanehirae TaxID=337451 RepID=A0A443PZG7_9MAGN|nr:cold-regulated 413 inner membrane protein 1, chloroplastic [Cinnamomum micranthum f. kanehirae]
MSLLLQFPHPISLSKTSSLLPFHPLSTPKQSILSFSSTQSNSLSLRFIPTQKNVRGRRGTVCYYTSFRPETLQWVCAVSSAVLMLTKGTTIQKSFIVPLFALQAPTTVISWIKGEYGGWSAFLALLVRLFYYIPGELELPFFALLLVIVAPYQAMNLRGTQAGAVISLAIAGFLALQHFSRIGSLQRAFDQGSIVATLAIICITIVPCLFLF